MVISRTTIDKLGIKLYDKVSAVVAELIANAYDADAENVIVRTPLGKYLSSKESGCITDCGYEIRVKDDGCGMTPDEVQNFYLLIGSDRRTRPEWGAFSRNKSRPVMGRKGIGKLAPFGICRQIEVISSGGEKTEKGYYTAHLILEYDGIIKDTDAPYFPKVGALDGTYFTEHGTEIILRNFAYRLIPDKATFHRQLAARFGIARSDWKITVQDMQSPDEFAVGDLDLDLLEDTKTDVGDHPIHLDDGTELPVKGWIAYSKVPYRDEVMAGIRIYARGKIVSQTRDFDIPSGFEGEYKLRSYLVGEICADWLDEDDAEDLVRSDRQDILWNSERGQALQKWGRELIKELASKGETSVRQKVWEEFSEQSNINERVKSEFDDKELRDSAIRVAKTMIRGVEREALKDKDLVNNLTKLAFSIAPHQQLVSNLHDISVKETGPFALLIELFDKARIAENYALGQVAFERIQVIKQLRSKWINSAEEIELQKIIQDAPWLINPQWTQLSANISLKNIQRDFVDWYKKNKKEDIVVTAISHSTKRPDFLLLNFRGRLEIVEIKKPDHAFTDDEFKRLQNYRYALVQFLEQNPSFSIIFHEGVHRTLVCDSLSLSRELEELFEKQCKDGELEYRKWQEFLIETEKVHEDFLSKSVDTTDTK